MIENMMQQNNKSAFTFFVVETFERLCSLQSHIKAGYCYSESYL